MESAELRKVVWLDSNQMIRWHDPEDVDYGPIKVTSVGWVLREDDESVTLSGSVVFGKDFQAADAMTIPKCCIVSQKTLEKR